MTKYIFVTGGVVSSVGKGIVVASIGQILKSSGLSVSVLKLDPYLNVDPGTMSPYQHGEVFVTKDGSETDLDLGHYERFIDIELTRSSNVTAGQIYSDVIARERRGDFLGGTIQSVPHVTDSIKERILAIAEESEADVIVVEVGGTVGDIEGQPFLEAIRQMRNKVGRDSVFYVHVTFLPYISATGELKTKPTQHSVRELRSTGIQPDSIICRSDQPVTDDIRDKIAVYCDVVAKGVIALETVATVYEVPLILEEGGLGDIIIESLALKSCTSNLAQWRGMVSSIKEPKSVLSVAVVGKYVSLPDAYISVKESLHHAGLHLNCDVDIQWIRAEDIEKHGPEEILGSVSGIVLPGGFGPRGVEGMIQTAKYARERGLPYFGLCLGLQVMVIEAARSLLGKAEANSTEFAEQTIDPVIDIMSEQKEITEIGGTMRLGLYPCELENNSMASRAYKKTLIYERHRHRFEVNNMYLDMFADVGLHASGVSPDGKLVEIMEMANHPFMVGVQFHPEFLSRPNRSHPLFREFVGVVQKTLREGGQHPLPIDSSAAPSKA